MTKRALLVWLTLCELFLSTFSGKLYKIYLEIKRNTQWKKNFNEHMTSWHQLLLKKLASHLFPRCISWRISLTYLQCNIWPFYINVSHQLNSDCELFLKWHFCSLNQSSPSFQYNVLQTCITDRSLHLCVSQLWAHERMLARETRRQTWIQQYLSTAESSDRDRNVLLRRKLNTK